MPERSIILHVFQSTCHTFFYLLRSLLAPTLELFLLHFSVKLKRAPFKEQGGRDEQHTMEQKDEVGLRIQLSSQTDIHF